jgi:hypothetical protein
MSELENNFTLLAQNFFTAFRSELQQEILRETKGKIKIINIFSL